MNNAVCFSIYPEQFGGVHLSPGISIFTHGIKLKLTPEIPLEKRSSLMKLIDLKI